MSHRDPAQRAQYEKRRQVNRRLKTAAGICQENGCKANFHPGKKICDLHLAKKHGVMVRFRQRLLVQGICPFCKRDMDREGQWCSSCCQARRDARLEALAKGLCVDCRIRPQDRPPKWSCSVCGLRNRVKHRDYRRRKEAKEQPWRFKDLKWQDVTVSDWQWRRLTGEAR